MAEEEKVQQADQPAARGKKKQTIMMLGILLFVMAAEGGGIYFAVKFIGGGPDKAVAEGLATTAVSGESGGHGGEGGAAAGSVVKDAELMVTKFKAPNLKSGRLYLYELEIYAKTKTEKSEGLKKLLEASKATIEDRLNRIVRSSEPQDLQEDGLETLRRQIRHELGQIVGDEKMIEEILIPKCTPFKVDY